MGDNLPDDVEPWIIDKHFGPPEMEVRMLDVTVAMDVEVSIHAEKDEVFKEIRRLLDHGDYVQVIDYEVMDKEYIGHD